MIRAIDYDSFVTRVRRQGESNSLFYEKHPTTEIASWTMKREFQASWPQVKEHVAGIIKCGSDLDALVRSRINLGLDVNSSTIGLLRKAYFEAFDASRMLGSSLLWGTESWGEINALS
jgi:hypothetical protein